MRLNRLAKTARANDLTGEGAKRAGRRWNYAGTPIIYTAQNGPLAVLGVLQYIEVTDVHKFSVLIINVPDDALIKRIDRDNLPDNWQQFPYPKKTKAIGRLWIERVTALLLEVPSAVYPDESNWLINPEHSMASTIQIVAVKPFVFNDRLFRRG
ncbi:MAG: RES family NAD+ phosphorylase [Rudanella sp.]|nr:RES family NAD+ phosphorylase [Rudanella sp.]